MGSLFSKNPDPPQTAPTPPAGTVRPRDEPADAPVHRPAKRRKHRRHTRAVPQLTRIQARPSEPSPDALVPPPVTRRKRKVAVFLGYTGENYHGMQINPGVPTIEQTLLNAFHSAHLIAPANRGSLQKVHWMRAARTDKGVSAAGQCVSAKLEVDVAGAIDPKVVADVNAHLPEDILIYGMLRATAAFSARSDCHRRRYEYMFPVRLLGGRNGPEEGKPAEGDPRVARFTSILNQYEGTHSFASFTDGLSGTEDAARRYMIRVRCGQPFLPPGSGVYYVTVEVFGQSFLLHQIRKMVGLALFVYLGHAPPETIAVALCPNVKIPTPMAPALGLLLDSLVFDNYNSRYEDVLDTPISVNAFGNAKDEFKLTRIYRKIAERERLERIMENWVNTCQQKLKYDRAHIANLHVKFVLSDLGREEQRRAHVASLYPIKTKLEDFLDSHDEGAVFQADILKKEFLKKYGVHPSFLARAPGRVILIGEHLDYNGLSVITTATSQGTMVAGCLNDTDLLEVSHLESQKYASGRLRNTGVRMSGDYAGESPGLDENWLQYVSWGVKAFEAGIGTSQKTVKGGGRLMFGGDLPRAGGLASSSSLVTVSALASARLNRRRIPRQELALLAAKGERVGAGTKGGAVDHTTSMCGIRGSALQISFTPRLGIAELPLPNGASLVAVDSGVTAEKGFDLNVKRQFNLRAAECRVGAAILARRLDVHLAKCVTTPGQLLFQARKTSILDCKSVSALKEKAAGVMKLGEVMTLEEIRREVNLSEVELQNRFLLGVTADKFQIGKRIAHVLSEAERVENFAELLKDSDMDNDIKLRRLGDILNEGQTSLKNLFESSCPQVDALVAFCRQSGAVGSRMTGAGWGGYTINLIPSGEVVQFLNLVIERFGDVAVVEVSPSSGACVYAMHKSYGASRQPRKANVGGKGELTSRPGIPRKPGAR